jgi:quercetin dioxygenase-like cupin family protein
MGIVVCEIPAGSSGPVNHHPGHELIVPLHGEMTLHFPGKGLTSRVAAGGYVHYQSDHEHCVGNAGSDTLRFLVIRFQG